ncbi:FCD domain-containing protein [Breoghania sp.]|uniref:FCD domain-containing protein n=1 Tax=Breoghania sp. TaxID=2065378 RepID=UPI00261EA5D1|nr:FCD domain-containing protein [Breoghania sp.]MDJ0930057.1 FCD domain-containing protein [Breoghania sp.]
MLCRPARRSARAGELDTYYYENERFHLVIYRACGNSYLCDQAMTLHRRLKPYRRLQLRVRGRMRRSLSEYCASRSDHEGEATAGGRGPEKPNPVQGEGFNDLVAGLEREKRQARAG